MTDDSSTEIGAELVGAVLADRYQLEATIGEGGIGRVYRARHLTLGNSLAVKVLLAKYQDREVLRRRFEREASTLAELSHPNIVKVADFGMHDGMPFLTMELLEGDDLAALLGRAEITPARGLAIMRQVLRALAYAHEHDVVHRDVKPHNVFVRALSETEDHVHVLDFGLARFDGRTRPGEKPLTRAGTVMGTPAYMSPEQATGERVDATADVYSSGVMLFEVLCGRRPFTSMVPADLLRAHLLEEPPDPRAVRPELGIDDALAALVARALAKPREERFESAGQMLEALDAIARPLGGAPARKTPVRAAPLAKTAPRAPAPEGGTDATSAERPSAKGAADPGGAAGLVAAGLVALGVASLVGVVWLVASDDNPPSRPTEAASDVTGAPAEPTPPVSPALGATAADVAVADLPTGVAAPAPPAGRDPFAAPLPEPLGALHAKVASGRGLSRREIQRLNAYGRAHLTDPRPRLIVAHHYVDARSLSWALPLYREAYALDRGARLDPEMLPDLLEMARSNSLADEAADFIAEAYGAEALEAVEEQLAGRLRPVEERRLRALAARLR